MTARPEAPRSPDHGLPQGMLVLTCARCGEVCASPEEIARYRTSAPAQRLAVFARRGDDDGRPYCRRCRAMEEWAERHGEAKNAGEGVRLLVALREKAEADAWAARNEVAQLHAEADATQLMLTQVGRERDRAEAALEAAEEAVRVANLRASAATAQAERAITALMLARLAE